MSRTTCPICSAAMPADWSEYPDFPFCSPRCRMIDLGRWLGENYRLASKGKDDNQSTADEPVPD